MTDSNWTGDDDQPRTNPYYNHGAGKRMDQQGSYGCPWPLVLAAVVVVGLGRLVWALVEVIPR